MNRTRLRRLWILLHLLLICCTTTGLTSATIDNPYMKKGTYEYERFTSSFVGTWEVVEMKTQKDQNLASQYEHIYVTIQLNPRLFSIEFIPVRGVIERRREQWEKKDKTLDIEDYSRLNIWNTWEAYEKGPAYDFDYISLPPQHAETSLTISGSGEKFEEFVSWEEMTSPIHGLRWLPERYLLDRIDDNTIRLFSYEAKGIEHWRRDTIQTDMILKRVL